MTLIVALKESENSVLLAADSQATGYGGIKTRISKIRSVANRPILWACSGNPYIGLSQFGHWIDSYKWSMPTWENFLTDARNELSRLNGAQVEATALAKAELGPDFVADCLFVGWLGELGIYAISSDGRIVEPVEDGIYAIGTGGAYAILVNKAIKEANQLNPEARLRIVMSTVGIGALDCGPPLECWRVTPKGKDLIFTL